MDTSWKTDTCECCIYRINEECRRFPNPIKIILKKRKELSQYYAEGFREYRFACAEYNEGDN